MTRLPVVGSDGNTWGTVLNAFLQVGHNASGGNSSAIPVFNVKDDAYGAKGDGTTDDTAAIQAAITAAQAAGGGTVFFPIGTYKVTSTLTISADNIQLIGAGWATQLLCGNALGGTYLILSQNPGPSTYRFGIVIRDLFINMNNQSVGGAIHLDCTYDAQINHVRIRFCTGTAIYLDASNNVFGSYTHISDCSITDGGAGLGILTYNHEFNTISNTLIAWYATAGGYGIKLQNGDNSIVGCTFDECDTSVWIWFQANNSIESCHFDRGITQFIYLNGCNNTTIIGNAFEGFVGTGSKNMINVDSGTNRSNIIAHNACKQSATWTNFVVEVSGSGTPGNSYTGNNVAPFGITRVSGIFRDNPGYNPVGHAVTQPAVAASTVAMTNTTGVDCTVFVTGGTVTVIAIGGTATGQIAGSFRVPAGQTIAYTYTVAPTHQWFGD